MTKMIPLEWRRARIKVWCKCGKEFHSSLSKPKVKCPNCNYMRAVSLLKKEYIELVLGIS